MHPMAVYLTSTSPRQQSLATGLSLASFLQKMRALVLLSLAATAPALLVGVRPSRMAVAPLHMSLPVSRRQFFASAATFSGGLVLGQSGALALDYKPGGGRAGEKIRRIARILDDMQRDIFEEDWTFISTYPVELRSFVPIFTKYTDTAFPTESAIDTQTRFALRYEVGRFFGAVERLKRAVDVRDLGEAEASFAQISISFDRYLKAGNLYEQYDPIVSTEKFYEGISDKDLVFVPPSAEPPKTRDLVLLIAGPDKGKTGLLIGIEQSDPVRGKKGIVKLDSLATGVKEIKVMPMSLIAKRIVK